MIFNYDLSGNIKNTQSNVQKVLKDNISFKYDYEPHCSNFKTGQLDQAQLECIEIASNNLSPFKSSELNQIQNENVIVEEIILIQLEEEVEVEIEDH